MNATEILKTIKEKLTAHFAVENFTEAKLNDGVTIVSWDGELAENNFLYVIDPTGQRLPAPQGDHTLEDGTIVTVVGEEGLITTVVKPVEEVEEELEVKPQETVQVSVPKRVIKSIVEEQQFKLEIEGIEPISVDLSEIFSKINEIKEANDTLNIELKKEKQLNSEVFELVKKLADEPSVPKTESTKKITRKEIKEMFNKIKN